MPTSKKLPTVPIIAAAVACQNEIPNPRKKDPYEIARKETFAAAQGQNNDRAFPYRDWETDRKSTRLNSRHRL